VTDRTVAAVGNKDEKPAGAAATYGLHQLIGYGSPDLPPPSAKAEASDGGQVEPRKEERRLDGGTAATVRDWHDLSAVRVPCEQAVVLLHEIEGRPVPAGEDHGVDGFDFVADAESVAREAANGAKIPVNDTDGSAPDQRYGPSFGRRIP
jgi:hypothetical protein